VSYTPRTLTPEQLDERRRFLRKRYGRAGVEPDRDEARRVLEVMSEAVQSEQERRREARRRKRGRAA
jgi:hypothetical protein